MNEVGINREGPYFTQFEDEIIQNPREGQRGWFDVDQGFARELKVFRNGVWKTKHVELELELAKV